MIIIVFCCYFHGLNVPIIRCLGGWNLKRFGCTGPRSAHPCGPGGCENWCLRRKDRRQLFCVCFSGLRTLYMLCAWIRLNMLCVHWHTYNTHTHIYILYLYTYTYKSHTHCTCLHTDTYKMRVFMHIHFSLSSVLLTCPSSKSQCQAADNKRGMDISAFWVREGGENDWIWVISTSLINMNGKDIRQTAAPFFWQDE